MSIAGKVFLYNDGKTVWYGAVNEGDETIGLTNNVFPTVRQAETVTVHDNHQSYGHGLEIAPGKTGMQPFPLGAGYANGYNARIAPGEGFRAGLRAASWAAMAIPPAGEVVVLDLAQDFHWYNGQSAAHSTHGTQIAHMRQYHLANMQKDVARSNPTLQQILGLMEFQRTGRNVRGEVTITPQADAQGRLTHWTVRADCQADPCVFTVVFSEQQPEGKVAVRKNDGIGLESMPLVGKGCAAEQRIEHKGNYGIDAVPGRVLRVGIRGFSSYGDTGPERLSLPTLAQGPVKVPFNVFQRNEGVIDEKFFDAKDIEEKRQEKLAQGKVRFSDPAGNWLNAPVEPLVLSGSKAMSSGAAYWPPPRLEVAGVGDAPDTPGGGWVVRVSSTLPSVDAKANGQAVGFVGTLELGDDREAYADPIQLPPKKFLVEGDVNTWFLPADAQLGAQVARAGTPLRVDTWAMGWSTVIPLPALGQSVDTERDLDRWSFRPHLEHQGRLYDREQLQRCRLGPDPR